MFQSGDPIFKTAERPANDWNIHSSILPPVLSTAIDPKETNVEPPYEIMKKELANA